MFAGYAFAIDYRDRRGHAYMLQDQEATRRVIERPQPGACLQCHTSVIPTYRRLGGGDVFKGFEALGKLPYAEAHAEVVKTGSSNPVAERTATAFQHVEGAHPVSCLDCHDPKSMELRVTRPGFIRGIQALAAGEAPMPHLESIERWRRGTRATPYDPNVDASRQEMRSFVCGQCHVEYYCGPKVTLFYPWNNGLKVEQIEDYYDHYTFPDGHRFYDWSHGETGAEVLKAQHPEFETWSQGIHARSGVACADCHMPYKREGAMKVSDHWVRSPLTNISRACQVCHPYAESEIQARVDAIQGRTHALLERSAAALTDLLDATKAARTGGATEQQLAPVLALQRKASGGSTSSPRRTPWDSTRRRKRRACWPRRSTTPGRASLLLRDRASVSRRGLSPARKGTDSGSSRRHPRQAVGLRTGLDARGDGQRLQVDDGHAVARADRHERARAVRRHLDARRAATEIDALDDRVAGGVEHEKLGGLRDPRSGHACRQW
jgi:formate-dependent nitrite reductase cytochrome c552 subunit